ncbi:hypothetical protein LCGC14_0147330 [marine sediment metagenome]|uniref:Helicase ATP-binding domain-containing protein n=1 Tax=marine sediment metagenome TaxID=412755 RepID=A0A0F9XHN3_9ZZZZ
MFNEDDVIQVYRSLLSNLGYTPRFTQEDAIKRVTQALNDYDDVILESPTGSGKSVIAMVFAKYISDTLEGNSFLLTPRKELQDQYSESFSDNVFVFKGAANYPCHLGISSGIPDADCGPTAQCAKGGFGGRNYGCCIGTPLAEVDFPLGPVPLNTQDLDSEKVYCNYLYNRHLALQSEILVMNFALFLSHVNYTGIFHKRSLLVLDEAHRCEEWLVSFAGVKLNEDRLKRLVPDLDIQSLSQYIEAVADDDPLGSAFMKDWLGSELLKIRKIAEIMEKTGGRPSDIHYLLSDVIPGLSLMNSSLDHTKWVGDRVEIISKGFKNKIVSYNFSPVFVDKFAKYMLLNKAPKRLFMSATILDSRAFSKSLGIEEHAFVRIASEFPAENRPFIISNTIGSLAYPKRTDEKMAKVTKEICDIVEHHSDCKGIIHTQSYKATNIISNALKENSTTRDRVITHLSGARRLNMFKEYTEREDNPVFITPSFTEGVDLKFDLARFQIMVFVPYASISDKRVKVRIGLGGWPWYNWLTALSIMQTYGRIVRDVEDTGVTYALDERFTDFISRHNSLFPDWFTEAVEYYE